MKWLRVKAESDSATGGAPVGLTGIKRCLLRGMVVGWLIAGWAAVPAATLTATAVEERQDWDVASRFFQGTAYDLAEQGFLGFVEKYPQSERVGEALSRFADDVARGAYPTLDESYLR